jgi:hypothetical protein
MDTIERIGLMSARELALLGMQDFAYIKRVIVDGAAGYAIHAADGTQIAVLGDTPTRSRAGKCPLIQDRTD